MKSARADCICHASTDTGRRCGCRLVASARTSVVALAVLAAVVMASSCSSNSHAKSPSTTVPVFESSTIASSTTTPTSAASTTTTSTATSTSTVPGVSLRDVNWTAIRYPIDCQGGAEVRERVQYATPAPGIQVAVAQVSCHVEATTPPSALLVYEPAGGSAQPRLVQELISYTDGWLFDRYHASATGVTASVAGYSSDTVVRATPDIAATLKWMWQGTSYHRVTPVALHEPFCSSFSSSCPPTTATGRT